MSRTFRHTNKDIKIMRGHVISYYFNCGWSSDERRAKRIKGGAVMCEKNEDTYGKYLRGLYTSGVPRKYRKLHNKIQKRKMEEEMNLKIRQERFDEIYCNSYVSNAGWYYY